MGTELCSLQRQLEKRAIIRALLLNPAWSLADIDRRIARGDSLGKQLGAITIAELCAEPKPDPDTIALDPLRRRRAMMAKGADFDVILLEILGEVSPRWVARSWLIARTGGPRWKLQAAIRRLEKAGSAERRGKTSATQYRRKGARAS